MKKIIDLLVVKVASNGEEFSQMISQRMVDNPKYHFLTREGNPYTPYYQQQLQKQMKLKEGGDEPGDG